MRTETILAALKLGESDEMVRILLQGFTNFEYRVGSDGRGIKVITFTADDGRSVTEEMNYCDFRDFRLMNYEELEEYYGELEEEYDEWLSHEDGISGDADYEEWEQALSEVESEMEAVEERMNELSGTS